MKDNRGIFCDDGAYNFEIYGNLITNIANSYCIDSRRVAGVENSSSRGANVNRSNVNNHIYGNVVDGPIRFNAREGNDHGCLLGVNYFIVKDEASIIHNEYSNLDSTGLEKSIVCRKSTNGKVYLGKSDYKGLKKDDSWPFFKKMD